MLRSEGSRSADSAAPISEVVELVVKRIRTKACQRCSKIEETLYRGRFDGSRNWSFVCPECLKTVKPGNPHYQYGGTWKSKKRH